MFHKKCRFIKKLYYIIDTVRRELKIPTVEYLKKIRNFCDFLTLFLSTYKFFKNSRFLMKYSLN